MAPQEGQAAAAVVATASVDPAWPPLPPPGVALRHRPLGPSHPRSQAGAFTLGCRPPTPRPSHTAPVQAPVAAVTAEQSGLTVRLASVSPSVEWENNAACFPGSL